MAATPLASEALEELDSAVVASGNGYFEPSDPVGQTSWGEGEGLSGDVLAPSDVDSLVDMIGKIEFKAEINNEDYIRYSNIEARGYFFDDDTVASGEGNPSHLGSQININGWSNEGSNWNGQSIEQSNGSTFIEYGENTKDTWGTRSFIRDLDRALQDTDSSSGYIFLQPESFRAEGLLGGSGLELRRNNTNGSNLTNLTESSPLVIDISPELSDEITELIDKSTIQFEQSDIKAFTSDFGAQGNITIKIADYLDEDGDLDTFELNSDIRLTLEIDNDAAEKLQSYDYAWSYVRLDSDNENGNNQHLYLHANDHDNDSGFSSHERDITTIVETTENNGTSFELTLDEWTIDEAKES